MTWATLAKRLDAYERLIRLDKPIGTLLLLWPTLWALWLPPPGTPRGPGVLPPLLRRHRADALGGLRHQRLCRPQFRSAREAHAAAAARGARDRAARGARRGGGRAEGCGLPGRT